MSELFSDQTTLDPNKNYLEELVGEGKKFATVEELARGKAEADLFINRITSENAEYRKKVEKATTLEEVVNQLQSLRGTTPPPSTPDNQNDKPREIDLTQINTLVSEQIAARERENREAQNFSTVVNVLTDKFGPGFQSEITKRASELGLGQQYLTNLAKEQPKAFLALMGAEERSTPSSVSTVRTSGLPKDRKNFAFYEQIRKTDPSRYQTHTVQNEMLRALAEQGDDFYK